MSRGNWFSRTYLNLNITRGMTLKRVFPPKINRRNFLWILNYLEYLAARIKIYIIKLSFNFFLIFWEIFVKWCFKKITKLKVYASSYFHKNVVRSKMGKDGIKCVAMAVMLVYKFKRTISKAVSNKRGPLLVWPDQTANWGCLSRRTISILNWTPSTAAPKDS